MSGYLLVGCEPVDCCRVSGSQLGSIDAARRRQSTPPHYTCPADEQYGLAKHEGAEEKTDTAQPEEVGGDRVIQVV